MDSLSDRQIVQTEGDSRDLQGVPYEDTECFVGTSSELAVPRRIENPLDMEVGTQRKET